MPGRNARAPLALFLQHRRRQPHYDRFRRRQRQRKLVFHRAGLPDRPRKVTMPTSTLK
jgi:hypothetical protein